MEKRIINIDILEENGVLLIKTEHTDIGTVYDHNAYRLKFDRPEKYKDDALKLVFFDGRKNYEPVNLGVVNEFDIPNALTLERSLSLQIAFENSANDLELSNVLAFTLRASLKQVGVKIESLPSSVIEALSKFCIVSDNEPTNQPDGGIWIQPIEE